MSEGTYRSVELTCRGPGRFTATNVRGGTLDLSSGEDEEFTPVELLLAALAGCTAIDADAVLSRRAEPERFDLRAEGHKIRDDQGNRMTELAVVLDLLFPDGAAGERAREAVPRTLAMVHDRLCTVSRTLTVGSPVRYVEVGAGDDAGR